MPILWPAQAGTENLKFLSYNSYIDKVHMYL